MPPFFTTFAQRVQIVIAICIQIVGGAINLIAVEIAFGIDIWVFERIMRKRHACPAGTAFLPYVLLFTRARPDARSDQDVKYFSHASTGISSNEAREIGNGQASQPDREDPRRA